MALQISEFSDMAFVRGSAAQLPDGVPANVVNLNTGQTHIVSSGIRVIRIAPLGGSFNVTWPNGEVERFDQAEYRAVESGVTIMATAV